MDSATVLDRAWLSICNSSTNQIKLRDIYRLIEKLAELSNTQILSEDLKDQLMTFILQNDNGMIFLDKEGFKDVFYQLFNTDFDDLFDKIDYTSTMNTNFNNRNDYTLHSFNRDTNYTYNRMNEMYPNGYSYKEFNNDALLSEINKLKRDYQIMVKRGKIKDITEVDSKLIMAYDELLNRRTEEIDYIQTRNTHVTNNRFSRLKNLMINQDKKIDKLAGKINYIEQNKGKTIKPSRLIRFKDALLSLAFKTTNNNINDSVSGMVNKFKSWLFILFILFLLFCISSLILGSLDDYTGI